MHASRNNISQLVDPGVYDFLNMFDQMVAAALSHGCEIWSF